VQCSSIVLTQAMATIPPVAQCQCVVSLARLRSQQYRRLPGTSQVAANPCCLLVMIEASAEHHSDGGTA
jgi:hypothetical protein